MRCETPPLLSDRRCRRPERCSRASPGTTGHRDPGRPSLGRCAPPRIAPCDPREPVVGAGAPPRPLASGSPGSGDPLPTLKLEALPDRRLRELGELALGRGVPASVLGRIVREPPEPIVLRGESEHAGGVGRPSATARRLDHRGPQAAGTCRHHPHPHRRPPGRSARGRSACCRTPRCAARRPGTGS